MNAAAPEWMEKVIISLFKKMVALKRPGAPTAETVGATLEVWLEVLGPNWDEEKDGKRVSEACRYLLATGTSWPQPADFLAAIPKKEPDAPKMREGTEEVSRQNLLIVREAIQKIKSSMTPQELERIKNADKEQERRWMFEERAERRGRRFR